MEVTIDAMTTPLGSSTAPASRGGVIPGPFLAAALLLAVVLFYLQSQTYFLGGYPGGSGAFDGVRLARSYLVTQLLTVVAMLPPVVALRWPVWAAAVPAVSIALTGLFLGAWAFTGFLALVAVAFVALWRDARVAAVVGVGSLLPVLALAAGVATMVAPFGYEIAIDASSDLGHRVVLVGLCAVAVTFALGAAVLLRRAVHGSQRAAELRARARAVQERAETVGERARLAHDLHDVVAHHVSLIAVRAETAPYTHPGLGEEARAVLGDIAADARAALTELRAVLGVLRRSEEDGPARAPQPTLGDVPGLVARAQEAGEDVALSERHDDGSPPDVEPELGYVAYRVVQEGLTNARRHAPGERVEVGVVSDGAWVRVRVRTASSTVAPDLRTTRGHGEPDGEGSDGGGPDGSGHGLVGMRERVAGLGGRLLVEDGPAGFVVTADLPRPGRGTDGTDGTDGVERTTAEPT